MIRKRNFAAILLLGLLVGCGGPDSITNAPTAVPAGETMQDIGEHIVHFSALTTDRLPSEVARTYSITRSRNRAMLNVSVIDKSDGKSVPANVDVTVSNLTGQIKNITIRRINEQEAIYYIGDITVANRENLIFDISVTPDGHQEPSDIRFMREFFTD